MVDTVYMMTSSNGNIFHVISPLWGEFTGHWVIPQRPVTQSFDGFFLTETEQMVVFFDMCLKKWLS